MTDDDRPSDLQAVQALTTAVLLRSLFVEVDRYRTAVASRLGVSLSEILVIEHLLLEGPLTIGEIGRRTLVGSSVVTGIVDRLERKGWTARTAGTDDRRERVVLLPEEARRKLGWLDRSLGHALGHLHATQLTAPLSVLPRLTEVLVGLTHRLGGATGASRPRRMR